MLLGPGEPDAPHLPLNVDGDVTVARDLERESMSAAESKSPESAIVKDTECGEIRTEGECGEEMEM